MRLELAGCETVCLKINALNALNVLIALVFLYDFNLLGVGWGRNVQGKVVHTDRV